MYNKLVSYTVYSYRENTCKTVVNTTRYLVGKNYGVSIQTSLNPPSAAPTTNCVSVLNRKLRSENSNYEVDSVVLPEAIPIQKENTLNVQQYVPGYRIISTYQNAPYSCEGTVSAVTVESYNYTTCYLDKTTPTPTSYIQLLNVGKLLNYLMCY